MDNKKNNDSGFWLVFIVFTLCVFILLKLLIPIVFFVIILGISFLIPRKINLEIIYTGNIVFTLLIYRMLKFETILIKHANENIETAFAKKVICDQIQNIEIAILISMLAVVTFFVLRFCQINPFKKLLSKFKNQKFIQIKPSNFAKKIEAKIIAPNENETHIGISFLSKKDIFINTLDRAKHLHVVGNSGTGKTNLLKYLIYQDIKNHRPTVIIDCKGDLDIKNYISDLVVNEYKSNLKLKVISISNHDAHFSYNPFYDLEPLTITQMLMTSFDLPKEGASKHYYDLAQTFILNILTITNLIPSKENELNELGVFVYLNRFFTRDNEPKNLLKSYIECKLQNAGISVESIDKILELIIDNKISKYEISDSTKTIISRIFDSDDLYLYLNKIIKILSTDRGRSDYAGISNMFNMFSSNQVKQVFDKSKNFELRLNSAIERNDIVLFQLSNQELPNFSELLGRLVISDICIRSGKIISNSNQKKIIPIHIDEFPLIASEEFATLLANARSSGLAFTIYHQALSQLNKTSGGSRVDLRDKISSVITTKIAFRQDNPDDVTWFVNQSGTFETREETRVEENSIFGKSATGRSSSRAADQTKINYNTIKELKVGEAVLIKKTPKLEIEALKIPLINFEINNSENIHMHKLLKDKPITYRERK